MRAHDPAPVRGVQMNRSIVESHAPLNHCRVEVGMGNRYRRDAAKFPDGLNGLLVQKRNAIPKHIAFRRLKQEGALVDRKGRFRVDGVEPRFPKLDPVMVPRTQLVERGPSLPIEANELARIGADRALGRWIHGWGELRAARHADEGLADRKPICHTLPPSGMRLRWMSE